MQKFDVQIMLEKIAEARTEWAVAKRDFDASVMKMMGRLLHEAARNYMSANEVAKMSGFTPKQVRTLMRIHGLDPKTGKRLLADKAAKALSENAELLGIQPHEMDLTSPLAYLPAGQELRKFLETKTVSQVTEVPETEYERLLRVSLLVTCGWCDAPFGKSCKEWDERFPEMHPSRLELGRIVLAAVEAGA